MLADVFSYGIAGILLAIAFYRKLGLSIILIICLSLAVDRLLFVQNPSWQYLHDWFAIIAIKDAIFALLIGLRHKTKELPIMICFFVSCLFHQYLIIEVNNQSLTMFYHRTDIMAWVVSGMLSNAIILTFGGGFNGGKRVKRTVYRPYGRLNSLFYSPAFEDGK